MKLRDFIMAIIVVILCFILEGAIAMWLWNTVIVALFNLNTIDLYIGCGIVFIIELAYGLFHNDAS